MTTTPGPARDPFRFLLLVLLLLAAGTGLAGTLTTSFEFNDANGQLP